uniref:Chromo domain-containing protein n=1 Tax=Crocodylus porosus TaxID=8502 RepID=A0A7M4F631_CROPO
MQSHPVLDRKRVQGKFHYLIDWDGYGPNDCSWEPAENMHDPELVAFQVSPQNIFFSQQLFC